MTSPTTQTEELAKRLETLLIDVTVLNPDEAAIVRQAAERLRTMEREVAELQRSVAWKDKAYNELSDAFEARLDQERERAESAERTVSSREETIRRLTDALQSLMDLQNGPPLETWASNWHEAMDEAAAALAARKAPHG